MNLVVGQSGLLGGIIARHLAQTNMPLRLLVRDSGTNLSGAEAVRGDLKDRASLDAACAGVRTVITTATSAQRGGDDNVDTVDIDGNFALIDAAAAAGVKRFIFVSTDAADESSPVPLFAAKARAEEHLRESGMAWTILAAHAFMDVWFPMLVGSAIGAGRAVPLVGGGRSRHSFIAVDDVASFAIAAVGNPAAANRRLVLGGPTAISFADVVAKTGAMMGRKLDIEELTPGAPIPTLPPPVDQVIGNLAAGLERQDVVIDMTETAREFGVTLTPAETVIARMLRG